MKISATTKLHGVELGKELSGSMATAIQEEIDWEILCELLTQAGWHRVEAAPPKDYAALKEWLSLHIKGHYKSRYSTWIFEQSEDAMWFALKWI